MKFCYKHLLNYIKCKPSINDLSNKLFQLGHEHEIYDSIFDIEITPNRGDCLSIDGLLRDLSVFYEISFERKVYTKKCRPLAFNFINNAPKECSHISFLKIEIANDIEPYKDYLDDYFDGLDINKNNFFTDISNYISYETGQPTHCYDAQTISGPLSLEIIDRELEFETLLDQKIKLKDKNLVFIHDGIIVNLAGIIGSKTSACNMKTRTVVIECANFNPECIIGKTVKYGIKSDAAYKFERGVDPLCQEYVLRRFINVVEDHAKIINIELFTDTYQDYIPVKLALDNKKINNILGISITEKIYCEYLEKLGFEINDSYVQIPSYRHDIKTQNDLAEEIARCIGYNNISAKSFILPKLSYTQSQLKKSEAFIRNYMIENGFFEVINNPFTDQESIKSIQVDNPLDTNRNFIRTDLRKSLIQNLLYNERRQKDSIKLFEISDIYYFDEVVQHKKMLGIICSGRLGKNYLDFSKKIDKTYLDNILGKLFPDKDLKIINIDRKEVASKSKSEIVYTEIEFKYCKHNSQTEIPKKSKNSFTKYKPISDYPSSSRDLSFSVKDIDKYYELQDTLLNFKHKLIKEIFIFDFYNNFNNNEIKIGFRFVFQSKSSTITDIEVNEVINQIIDISLDINSVEIPGLN